MPCLSGGDFIAMLQKSRSKFNVLDSAYSSEFTLLTYPDFTYFWNTSHKLHFNIDKSYQWNIKKWLKKMKTVKLPFIGLTIKELWIYIIKYKGQKIKIL